MKIEEFVKKHLNIELKPHQLRYLLYLHKKELRNIIVKPRGKRYDLVVFDDIEEK